MKDRASKPQACPLNATTIEGRQHHPLSNESLCGGQSHGPETFRTTESVGIHSIKPCLCAKDVSFVLRASEVVLREEGHRIVCLDFVIENDLQLVWSW